MHLQVRRRRRRAHPLTSIGILGGTFNPPHIGHLVCAQEARAQLGLDRVVLMPVAVPPHKDAVAEDPGATVRAALCQAAVRGDRQLVVSEAEILRGGASYTVDTLRGIHATAPEDALTFIVGGDMAHSLPTWRAPVEILHLASLGIAEREGIGRADIAERLAPLLAEAELTEADALHFFEMPRLDVSSSDIRRRVAEGRPIRHLVPDAVATEIVTRGLYRGGPTA